MSKLLILPLTLLLSACHHEPPAAKPEAPPPPVAEPIPPPSPPETPVVPVATQPDPPPSALAEEQQFCAAELAAAQASVDKLFAVAGEHTITNTLDVFNDVERHLNRAGERAQLIGEVHPEPTVRDAARACAQAGVKLSSDLFADKRGFDAVTAVKLSAKDDAVTHRYRDQVLRDYRRSGIALPDAKRDRIKAIDADLVDTEQQFAKGIAEDTRFILVTDPKRLGGMPADWVAAHKPDDKGAIKITTDYPDYIPFITYADDDGLRKDLYLQSKLRGSAHNGALLQHALVLRAERAKLLGFKDWADYESDDKMLRTGKKATEFIAQVAGPTKARAQKDYAELLKELRTIDPKATAVGDWQKSYLENRVKQKTYAVDAQEVRKYFAFDKALGGLLQITGQIYDIQYKPVPVSEAHAWDAAVQTFDVMRGQTKLGRIYLDLHPRDGKFKHAAMFPIVDGVTSLEPGSSSNTVTGEVQLPEGALICNLPGPTTATDPGYMDHGDVVTMFHEFGHLMHHVLGGNHHFVRQSGVATEADFVEAPSQMFEDWGWRYETLAKFATNAAGDTIPKDLVDKMRKAYRFGRGSGTAQQMFYAALSLQLHQLDPAKLDPAGQTALVKKLQAQYTPFGFVEGTRVQDSFGHLMGYSSRYYTYMWSLAIAKDLLTAFAKTGLLDTTTTFRYRDKILAPGGTKDAADLVRDFLGRPYNFTAFQKYLAE